MNTNKLILSFLLLTFSTASFASLAVDSIATTFGRGGRPTNVELYQVSAQWDWNKPWLKWGNFYLDGYFSLSLSHIRSDGDENDRNKSLWSASIVPMFRYQYHSSHPWGIDPYIEAGVGPAAFSQTRLDEKKFSTNYQLDDRIGAGFRFGRDRQFDLTWRYQHYSNANIKRPNQGIDIKYVGVFTYHFS